MEFLYCFWRARVECVVNQFHFRLATYPTTKPKIQRVDRVHRSASAPFWFRGGGAHSLAGEGLGGPNSDERTDTVVLQV
jgi:hypothetical protein